VAIHPDVRAQVRRGVAFGSSCRAGGFCGLLCSEERAAPWRESLHNHLATQAKQDGLTIHDIRRGTDPPTFLMIFALLSTMPLHTAYAIWLLTNFTCLAFALFLLIRPNLHIDPMATLILTGFAILYPPIPFHFWFSQSKQLFL
jgi:hypothetical protein